MSARDYLKLYAVHTPRMIHRGCVFDIPSFDRTHSDNGIDALHIERFSVDENIRVMAMPDPSLNKKRQTTNGAVTSASNWSIVRSDSGSAMEGALGLYLSSSSLVLAP